MDQQPADDIRFFDYSSRIGRLRYFAYGMGVFLLILPALILAGVVWAFKMPFLAGLLLVACYVFMIVMGIVFGIRRLHDLGWTGWWMLISGVSLVCSLLNLAGALHGAVVAIVSLGAFILYLVLLFAPGTQGDNKFGPPPPPNSTWVIVGAWSFLIVPFFGGILAAIAIPAYQDYIARSQTVEAIQLAGGAEQSVTAYHDKNKAWPTDLSSLYPQDVDGGIGRYSVGLTAVTVTDGSVFGIMVTMKQTGVARPLAGKSLEVWTSDGRTWHCGPSSMDSIEPRYLPASCRETGAP
ncbi:MAG TPA: DUF805 domain-containing protein [Gammaproteobacteria bacterium]|nr:DUF805 domain-containing protein [Gammaproteobacteria bacterium]